MPPITEFLAPTGLAKQTHGGFVLLSFNDLTCPPHAVFLSRGRCPPSRLLAFIGASLTPAPRIPLPNYLLPEGPYPVQLLPVFKIPENSCRSQPPFYSTIRNPHSIPPPRSGTRMTIQSFCADSLCECWCPCDSCPLVFSPFPRRPFISANI